MPRVFAQQHYRQNAETVWQRIQDFSDLSWLPGVTGCNVTGHGVGAIRTVSTKDGGTVKEELVTFDAAQRMFGYHILQAPGVREETDYQATVAVVATDSGCKVIWQASFNGGSAPPDNVETARQGAEQMYQYCLSHLATLLDQ